MSKKPSEPEDIEQIAQRAQNGEDVSEYFTNNYVAKQQVTVDFPLELLRAIDSQCNLLGISRQDWIKLACEKKIHTDITAVPKAS
jgi:hypothetical protein